jgi:dihydrofolate reductase
MGKPLLMGRKTFESIGRILPGRETIVVTRDRAFDASRGGGQTNCIHVAYELEAALALAQARAQAMGAEEIILAGGGNLYESLIGHAERMHLTFVDVAPRGAVSFPEIDWSNWLEVSRVRPRPSAKDEATFAFVDFDRRHCLSL